MLLIHSTVSVSVKKEMKEEKERLELFLTTEKGKGIKQCIQKQAQHTMHLMGKGVGLVT